MNFDFPHSLVLPVTLSALFPVVLLGVTSLARLSGRNALQFVLAAAITLAAWIVLAAAAPTPYSAVAVLDWMLGGTVLASALLLWLEAWALLSRGYTLSLLVILAAQTAAIAPSELAMLYRGGRGLGWIMEHRVSGLIASGVLARKEGRLVITPLRGRLVSLLHRVAIKVLGLRRVG